MDALTKKTILLISPQPWNAMFLSKHHYAIQLAKQGNTVYFLCPLDEFRQGKITDINIQPSGYENLFLLEHRLFFPFQVKFHAPALFHWLIRFHLTRIVKKINRTIEIVWSFDIGNFFPFNFFEKKTFKIFHPVDEPLNNEAIESANGADIMFSVTTEILDKYHAFNMPRHFINHGLADEFLSPVHTQPVHDGKLHVGFSGNLRRNDIDRKVLLEIITENPQIIFDCWGEYSTEKLGLVKPDKATVLFIEALKNLHNVFLHGKVSPKELSVCIRNVDAFLICYDVNKDQSKGTNYHKVMEFISTGKVIISNNISTYKNAPSLVQMVEERDNNLALASLFTKVLANLSFYNSPDLQAERRYFAADNTYGKQVARIENIICRKETAILN